MIDIITIEIAIETVEGKAGIVEIEPETRTLNFGILRHFGGVEAGALIEIEIEIVIGIREGATINRIASIVMTTEGEGGGDSANNKFFFT